jgi:hypothetical protein
MSQSRHAGHHSRAGQVEIQYQRRVVPQHRQVQSFGCGWANFLLHSDFVEGRAHNTLSMLLAAHQQGIERHKVAA